MKRYLTKKNIVLFMLLIWIPAAYIDSLLSPGSFGWFFILCASEIICMLMGMIIGERLIILKQGSIKKNE